MNKTTMTRDDWTKLRYPVQLQELSSEEGGGWVAHIPLLGRGLFMADGDTPTEALERLEALRLEMYDTVASSGALLPLPEEAEDPVASGKWLMRTARSLHARLRNRADVEGVSLNSLCESLLVQGLAQRHAEDAMATLAEGMLDDFRLQVAREARRARYSFQGLKTNVPVEAGSEYLYANFTEDENAA